MVDKHSGCPIPDGRELKSEIQNDGSKTLYYVNLGTGIRVNSVEDMFCYKNSKSGENNPNQNYVNLGTGIRVNSVEDMFRYKDRESGENTPKQTGGRTKVGHQFCSRCKEVGHNIFRCPFSGTLSHGTVTLQSTSDVRVAPNVTFNYYSNSTDLAHCVSGMKKIGEFLSSDALKPYKVEDLPAIEGFDILGIPLPENQTDDAAFETFCQEAVASYWHYHGGCLVGEVLDDDFRVTGINALRVVDGSTFPSTPASHPQGFYLMLGRYVGSKILQGRFVVTFWPS
ncbi:PREDICTED: (R)-mandelonitrile lyase 2-like isoform X1 [Prunus mume]|uniref:(R)-mandelonitrile lyase 2-like isoform X1 n=1 Tax=Prunus mume TaxID=102107 RepID=A0ABM1LQD1_PRUMU|nr:PREDICTED: (R)-mandelonitrile lyase 2-like isoform X1 [Prunus mume]XP_008232764.1 PREDICTED: (R)-mandelonitrile lyase 2-like isoform X1 [Prunus mume]XP_016649607.1 PREDICTED: (R)-mandelonitrile lyase 2-like isoform X1 [Prunus mume]XP_016649608.1 PREDICTED: (R)-mandelonitrile lyase 2-like isoform X1 [Prunus mume]